MVQWCGRLERKFGGLGDDDDDDRKRCVKRSVRVRCGFGSGICGGNGGFSFFFSFLLGLGLFCFAPMISMKLLYTSTLRPLKDPQFFEQNSFLATMDMEGVLE